MCFTLFIRSFLSLPLKRFQSLFEWWWRLSNASTCYTYLCEGVCVKSWFQKTLLGKRYQLIQMFVSLCCELEVQSHKVLLSLRVTCPFFLSAGCRNSCDASSGTRRNPTLRRHPRNPRKRRKRLCCWRWDRTLPFVKSRIGCQVWISHSPVARGKAEWWSCHFHGVSGCR